MKRATILASLALIVASTSLTACGRELPAQALIGVTEIAPEDRATAPVITGSTLDGDSLSTSDLRGKVVVLNGWASWCEPCREEIPALVDFADSADPQDIAVIGVNVSDEGPAASSFADDLGMTYPSIVDSDATIWGKIPGIPPRSLPSTVILDRDGRIAATIVGVADVTQLHSLTETLSAEGG